MIKLTKTELRQQQYRLQQLCKYLPTLQLKKMLLQVEVNQAEAELVELRKVFAECEKAIGSFVALLTDKNAFDLFPAIKIADVIVSHENVAGVEVPIFQQVQFQKHDYFLFDSPAWLDSAIVEVQKLMIVKEKIRIAGEKKKALARELKEVSIRVNLFEKVLIPRTTDNIRKITIFLGDQQLAAVCRAKVSKQKIIQREKQEVFD